MRQLFSSSITSIFAAVGLAALAVAPLAACKSAAKSNDPAAAPGANAPTDPANPEKPPQAPAFTPPAVECDKVFTPEEASALCGVPLSMQILPDEARGRTHPVTCSRAFMAQNGARVSFRVQTDPRGDAENNVKAFNAETRFPRSWETVEKVDNLGDGARHFLQHGRALKAPMATKNPAMPANLGNASRHVRAVKGFWKVSIEATAPTATDAEIICSFDQLEGQARKIVSRLP